MTYLGSLGGRRPTYQEVAHIGREVVVDGAWYGIVTKTSVYINNRQDRETGVSVRPVDGGRARPVSLSRLTLPR